MAPRGRISGSNAQTQLHEGIVVRPARCNAVPDAHVGLATWHRHHLIGSFISPSLHLHLHLHLLTRMTRMTRR
jgi:hypothetical protein